MQQVTKKTWKANYQFLIDENRTVMQKARQAEQKAEDLDKKYESLDEHYVSSAAMWELTRKFEEIEKRMVSVEERDSYGSESEDNSQEGSIPEVALSTRSDNCEKKSRHSLKHVTSNPKLVADEDV